MTKSSDLVVCKVDRGRCSIVYKTQNSLGEQIYYALLQGHGIEFFRCSQPFKEYGESIYEPQSKANPRNTVRVELPRGNSDLEVSVRNYINCHPKMVGF